MPLKNRLFRYAFYFLRDEEDARDMVQEVLIRIWNRRDAMEQYLNVEAWCMRVMRNACLDKLKSGYHRFRQELSGIKMASGIVSPAADLEHKDQVHQMEKLLEQLPEKQRELIQLRDIEGLSYQEIAKVMELDLNQVKVYLFRARQFLRERLEKINNYGTGEN